jgi:hypothetical protein
MNLALYSVLRLHIGIEDPCWESLHEAVTDECLVFHSKYATATSIVVELG